MSDVFLSYARTDTKVAERLAGLLESGGLDVWWDHRLIAGDDFNAKIEKSLNDARCVIVLWSPVSVNSNWVRGEAQRAFEQHKLIPAMIADCQLPINFGQIHTPRVYESAQQLSDLANQLTNRLGRPHDASQENPSKVADRQAEQATEVVFAPSAAHRFLEDLKAFDKNPGPTISDRFRNNLKLWRAHPIKMTLFLVAIALIGTAVTAAYEGYRFYYGECSEVDAQWASIYQVAVTRAKQQYSIDGDEAGYRARLQEAEAVARWIPRQCLASMPIAPATAAPCPQRWSSYEQCVAQRKKDIVAGKPLRLCIEPDCPRH